MLTKEQAELRAAFTEALANVRLGRAATAERQLRAIQAVAPGDVNSLRLLGVALLDQDKDAAALETLERAARGAPAFWAARADLARAYRKVGRLEDARRELRSVVARAPTLEGAWLAYGDVLVDLGKFVDARVAYERARLADPQRARIEEARAALATEDRKTGPEFKQYYSKTVDFHLDGDIGIGDLVFASAWWAQDDRWVNEYSEYMQYVNVTPGVGGFNVPIQYYDYDNDTSRWSNELRLQSKEGGWFHWLLGSYWEKTKNPYFNYYHMPGMQYKGDACQAASASYYNSLPPPKPDDWFSYVARSDYQQVTEFTNEVIDILPTLHLELGTVHFQSHFSDSTYGGYWYAPQTPAYAGGSSEKWNSKAGLSWNVTKSVLLYADAAQGFRDGGVNPRAYPQSA